MQGVRDAHEAGLPGRDAPVAPDGGLEGLPVVLEDHRDLRPLQEGAREDVCVHRPAVELLEEAPRSEVREAHPQSVAVRLLAHVAHDDVLRFGPLGLLHPRDAEAADHVRVHPRPGVVFAEGVDEEDVDLPDRELRHQPLVLGEQLLLAARDVRGWDRLEKGRFVVGVLHRRDAEQDLPGVDDLPAHLDHEVPDALDPVAVQGEGLLVLAEADGGHLEEAALDRASKVRVRLDPVHQDDAVRLVRDPVHIHRHPARRLAELHDVHGRADRRPTELLRHAEAPQDLDLTLGGRPAVAPHRRHDKRLRPHLLQDGDQGAQDDVYLRDAAAPGGQRDLHPRPDAGGDLVAPELFPQRRLHVPHTRPQEALPHLDHLRKLHPGPPSALPSPATHPTTSRKTARSRRWRAPASRSGRSALPPGPKRTRNPRSNPRAGPPTEP